MTNGDIQMKFDPVYEGYKIRNQPKVSVPSLPAIPEPVIDFDARSCLADSPIFEDDTEDSDTPTDDSWPHNSYYSVTALTHNLRISARYLSHTSLRIGMIECILIPRIESANTLSICNCINWRSYYLSELIAEKVYIW